MLPRYSYALYEILIIKKERLLPVTIVITLIPCLMAYERRFTEKIQYAIFSLFLLQAHDYHYLQGSVNNFRTKKNPQQFGKSGHMLRIIISVLSCASIDTSKPSARREAARNVKEYN